MTIAGDYVGRVRLGVTIGAAGSQSFVWPDGRPAGTYTADAGPDGSITLTVTEPDADTLTVAWAGADSRRMIGHPWRVLRDGAWLFGDLYVTETEPADQDPTDFTVIDGVVEVRVAMVEPGGGGGGVTDHGDLTGRNDPDQHTSDAITVPAGTMAFIEAFYPPDSDTLKDHLDAVDNAIEAAAGGIVGAYALANTKLDADEKGAANGVAELDGSGLVLSAQLPSYVDDVIVVADFAALPGTGADGKIYVTSDTNLTYRWTGSAYVEISKSLALGTTSATAYRGDHGTATALGLLDLSGVDPGSQATARGNLGLGSLAVKSAVERTDIATGAIDAALLDAAVVTSISNAYARGNHTGTQAASTVTGLPWHDDFIILHMVRDPLPITGSAPTFVGGTQRGGGYAYTSATGWVWTFARIPLRAGTYTRRFVRRTDNQAGIVVFTIGGIAAGSADGYSASSVNDVVDDATGIVIPSDGFYDLVMTSTTKHASSGNYRANAQFTSLFRTGA